jgi:hypothetical protein
LSNPGLIKNSCKERKGRRKETLTVTRDTDIFGIEIKFPLILYLEHTSCNLFKDFPLNLDIFVYQKDLIPTLIPVFRLQNKLCEFATRTHKSDGYFVPKNRV